ncbi:hypothetical protein [Sphingomonas sp. DT-204]|uniref:hypothetical protein n=1 Tax=Sphingomonas sp. DT-204 TaxID=3396166 RepID=UPI003F197F82
MIDHYDWAGGREAMLRFGPAGGPVVMFAQPLFEEANRTRALIVTIARALARRGVASALPDLPGTGESLVPTVEATLEGWQSAYAAAATAIERPALSAAIRGGALIDGTAPVTARWRLAPVEGAVLVREMLRTRITAAANEEGKRVDPGPLDRQGPALELAGNLIARPLLASLEAAAPAPGRIVRLESDPKPADLKLSGAPLWRRAEPGNDPVFAEELADDITHWVRSCEG